MNKILLVTRSDHEITTRYLSAWSGKIIELARKKNIQVMDLKRDKANLKELKSRAAKMRPLFIILNGHGSDDCVTGYDDKILIKAGNNESILESKITYAVSCRSAAKLGIESVKAGALAYIGYTGDFRHW
jgi:asparagine synthetase B (glutamine-hydrolysing)